MPLPLIQKKAPRFVRLNGAHSIGSASAHPQDGEHLAGGSWALLGAGRRYSECPWAPLE
jgi:hypothetical protein